MCYHIGEGEITIPQLIEPIELPRGNEYGQRQGCGVSIRY